MKRNCIQVLLIMLLNHALVQAQAPVINSVTPVTSFSGDKLVIAGSGFGTNAAQVRVLFDQVAGTVTSITDLSIQVTILPQARLNNVEVINLTTGLSAKSGLKFVPNYGGTDFDPTKVAPALSFSAGANEVFDVCSCDLDGDGKPDMIGSKQGLATDLMILRNTSSPGSLSYVSSNVNILTQTFNLACGDLNGDGKPDVIASRGDANKNEVFVLKTVEKKQQNGMRKKVPRRSAQFGVYVLSRTQ